MSRISLAIVLTSLSLSLCGTAFAEKPIFVPKKANVAELACKTYTVPGGSDIPGNSHCCMGYNSSSEPMSCVVRKCGRTYEVVSTNCKGPYIH